MKATQRLRRDHQILRAKLDVLETALSMGPQTWFVLREICFTLSRQLRDHIKREEALIAASRGVAAADVLAHLAIEHRDEPEHLRDINRLFTSQAAHSLEQITPVLLNVIAGLRCHMAEEEAALFPLLERALAGQEPVGGAQQPAPPRAPLDETMTVNGVVDKFPNTRRVFEGLFVSIPFEGCTCLDEVAWRHGIESRELLERLERVVREGEVGEARSGPVDERYVRAGNS